MSAASPIARNLLPCAGFVVAPAVWAVNMQWGQIAPYVDCPTRSHLNVIVSFAAALIALASAWISWRSAGDEKAGTAKGSAYPISYRFVALLGSLAGLVFAYALALQALSGVLLTGCER